MVRGPTLAEVECAELITLVGPAVHSVLVPVPPGGDDRGRADDDVLRPPPATVGARASTPVGCVCSPGRGW